MTSASTSFSVLARHQSCDAWKSEVQLQNRVSLWVNGVFVPVVLVIIRGILDGNRVELSVDFKLEERRHRRTRHPQTNNADRGDTYWCECANSSLPSSQSPPQWEMRGTAGPKTPAASDEPMRPPPHSPLAGPFRVQWKWSDNPEEATNLAGGQWRHHGGGG